MTSGIYIMLQNTGNDLAQEFVECNDPYDIGDDEQDRLRIAVCKIMSSGIREGDVISFLNSDEMDH